MPSYTLGHTVPEKAADPDLYNDQIARMVRDRAEFSRQESLTLRRRSTVFYDLWRGYIRARSQPFRNQVHLPLLFSSIETGVSIKHGLLLGQKPFVEFVPNSVEDAPAARRASALNQQQLEDVDIDEKLELILRAGDIVGICPFQWSWKYIKNLRPQRVPLLTSEAGAALSQVILGETVDFDGPWLDVVDVLDWFPDPSAINVKGMKWCIRRYWLDMDDIASLVDAGLFDPEGYEKMKLSQGTSESTGDFENRRGSPGGMRWSLPNAATTDKYSKPVEILEMHGVWPNELVPEDGFNNRLVTIGNGIAVLRNVPNPHWSSGLPFGAYTPTPDPYSIWGVGKVEPNDKLQATASRFASQRLDAMDYLIDPMMAYDQLANVDTDKLYCRPGGLVGGDGNPNEWLQAIHPDMQGMKQGLQEIEALWRWMQHGTGITEEAIGGSGGGTGAQGGASRQTAREFIGKMENVQKRMVREALRAANQILLPVSESFRALSSQFLPLPKMIRIMGQKALLDPVSGMPIPPDSEVLLEDIINKYDMRAASAASLIGRSAKQQNDVLLLQALAASPAAPVINWYAFIREMLIDFEKANPDELLVPISPEQVMMQQMATQLAAQPPGTSPNSATPGGPSKQNPDVLDQMVSPEGSTSSQTTTQSGGGKN